MRLQGDHHCACAQKWCHFSFFFKSFQTKKIKAQRPKMTKIASRGSCLSDLPSVVRGSSALFADDTLAYDHCTGTISSANPDCSSSSSCCRLQSDVQTVNHWSNQTSTTFNPSKSVVMAFRGKRKDALSSDECDILLGDSPVPHCAETKHLGVTITQSLSWTPHVDKLLQHASYKAYILKRLAYRCNSGSEFVAHLYLTLVRPVRGSEQKKGGGGDATPSHSTLPGLPQHVGT